MSIVPLSRSCAELTKMMEETKGNDQKTLWVFDLDGTLLVSQGREIIEFNGMRACIHPLIESHVQCVLPKARSSDYRYCGEEDMHGDPHGLIDTAAVIEPVASVLRRVLRDTDPGRREVGILTARAHDPEWLSARLTKKFDLADGDIRPDLIQCVYSEAFEKNVCSGSTAERKAAALHILVSRAEADAVHFFDDVQANLDFVLTHFARTEMMASRKRCRVYPHFVDFELSIKALEAAGVQALDVFHPQLRTERDNEPNELVNAISRQLSYSNLKELQSLAESKPPLSPKAIDPSFFSKPIHPASAKETIAPSVPSPLILEDPAASHALSVHASLRHCLPP